MIDLGNSVISDFPNQYSFAQGLPTSARNQYYRMRDSLELISLCLLTAKYAANIRRSIAVIDRIRYEISLLPMSPPRLSLAGNV